MFVLDKGRYPFGAFGERRAADLSLPGPEIPAPAAHGKQG
jgi:hypothetical protein